MEGGNNSGGRQGEGAERALYRKCPQEGQWERRGRVSLKRSL